MISRKIFAAFAGISLLSIATTASAAPFYTIDFLPTGFQGARLNDAGQVVGTAGDTAALYSGGLVTGMAPSPSAGFGINNHGDIVGTLGDFYIAEAFTSVGGVVTNLDPLIEGGTLVSNGVAINDHGVVGGNIYRGGENYRGFILRDGVVEHIGTFGGDYSPLEAINKYGAATGYAGFPGPVGGNYFHAYIYQNGTLQDLGTFGEADSWGTDINDLGQVSGHAGNIPFLYSGGSLIDLGGLGNYGGSATALNNAGVVVGSSASPLTPGGTGGHAFVYADGVMTDLNALVAPLAGWELTIASDINNAGQILGTACRDGSCASVLLTAVPEPSAGLMLLAGLGALAPLTSRRRRQKAH